MHNGRFIVEKYCVSAVNLQNSSNSSVTAVERVYLQLQLYFCERTVSIFCECCDFVTFICGGKITETNKSLYL